MKNKPTPKDPQKRNKHRKAMKGLSSPRKLKTLMKKSAEKGGVKKPKQKRGLFKKK